MVTLYLGQSNKVKKMEVILNIVFRLQVIEGQNEHSLSQNRRLFSITIQFIYLN